MRLIMTPIKGDAQVQQALHTHTDGVSGMRGAPLVESARLLKDVMAYFDLLGHGDGVLEHRVPPLALGAGIYSTVSTDTAPSHKKVRWPIKDLTVIFHPTSTSSLSVFLVGPSITASLCSSVDGTNGRFYYTLPGGRAYYVTFNTGAGEGLCLNNMDMLLALAEMRHLDLAGAQTAAVGLAQQRVLEPGVDSAERVKLEEAIYRLTTARDAAKAGKEAAAAAADETEKTPANAGMDRYEVLRDTGPEERLKKAAQDAYQFARDTVKRLRRDEDSFQARIKELTSARNSILAKAGKETPRSADLLRRLQTSEKDYADAVEAADNAETLLESAAELKTKSSESLKDAKAEAAADKYKVLREEESSKLERIMLLAGLPDHLEHFKTYWWCGHQFTGNLTDFVPDDVIVETIDPMVFQYDGAPSADHVTSLWDKTFRLTHMYYYDYVVLPDLGGPWHQAQISAVSIDGLVELMVQAMDLVKPGGCGIFDKIYMQDDMKQLIAEKGESIVYGKEEFALEQHILPSGLLAVVLWKEKSSDPLRQNAKSYGETPQSAAVETESAYKSAVDNEERLKKVAQDAFQSARDTAKRLRREEDSFQSRIKEVTSEWKSIMAKEGKETPRSAELLRFLSKLEKDYADAVIAADNAETLLESAAELKMESSESLKDAEAEAAAEKYKVLREAEHEAEDGGDEEAKSAVETAQEEYQIAKHTADRLQRQAESWKTRVGAITSEWTSKMAKEGKETQQSSGLLRLMTELEKEYSNAVEDARAADAAAAAAKAQVKEEEAKAAAEDESYGVFRRRIEDEWKANNRRFNEDLANAKAERKAKTATADQKVAEAEAAVQDATTIYNNADIANDAAVLHESDVLKEWQSRRETSHSFAAGEGAEYEQRTKMLKDAREEVATTRLALVKAENAKNDAGNEAVAFKAAADEVLGDVRAAEARSASVERMMPHLFTFLDENPMLVEADGDHEYGKRMVHNALSMPGPASLEELSFVHLVTSGLDAHIEEMKEIVNQLADTENSITGRTQAFSEAASAREKDEMSQILKLLRAKQVSLEQKITDNKKRQARSRLILSWFEAGRGDAVESTPTSLNRRRAEAKDADAEHGENNKYT